MAQQSSGAAITIQKIRPQQAGRLKLASPAIGDDGRIDDIYSGYHDNLSPALEWTAIPEAETFALIVEDPDAPTDNPVLHWVAWNIPGALDALPRGLRVAPTLDEFGGLVQGRNAQGEFGYMGPKPPPGDGRHHYHFQLFALDARLDLPASTPLEALVNILKANAIAACELIGTYAQADPASPAAPQPSERSFAAQADRGGLDEDDVDRHAPHDESGTVRPGA